MAVAVVITMKEQGQRQALEITRGTFPWLLNADILSHFGILRSAVCFFSFGGARAQRMLLQIYTAVN